MNTIRNFFLWLTAASAICAPSHLAAVPAYPGSRLVTQPDGSKIELHLLGDEYGHVTVNADGTPVEPDDNGYWRPSGKSTQEMLSMRRNKISRKRPTKKVPAFPRTGEVRSLIVLVEFPDVKFVTPDVHREFSEMLNLPGFDRREHIGCAADYFRTQSMGQFSPAFDVYGPVMADKAATYYGENDANGDDFRAYELVIELCRKLDNEINFADYDLDGDGQVDNIYFFYAGYGENFAGNKAAWIWPHANHIDLLGVPEAERTFDGKVINSYGCCAELYGSTGSDTSAIGTFCHEFGHILGLPDTYDVNYSVDGSANHPDKWDIMASGSYLPETRNCGAVPAGCHTSAAAFIGSFGPYLHIRSRRIFHSRKPPESGRLLRPIHTVPRPAGVACRPSSRRNHIGHHRRRKTDHHMRTGLGTRIQCPEYEPDAPMPRNRESFRQRRQQIHPRHPFPGATDAHSVHRRNRTVNEIMERTAHRKTGYKHPRTRRQHTFRLHGRFRPRNKDKSPRSRQYYKQLFHSQLGSIARRSRRIPSAPL